MNQEYPTLTKGAIEWIEQNVKTSWTVFEWGSGRSTIYWASKNIPAITIEHNKVWYDKTKTSIKKEGLTSHLKLIPGVPFMPTKYIISARQKKHSHLPEKYISSVSAYVNQSFRNYAQAIDEYPNNHFDLVLVDGRARPSCIKHAIPKIKEGGFLILDNAPPDRPRYNIAVRLMKHWDYVSYHMTGTKEQNKWTTTIFKKSKVE